MIEIAKEIRIDSTDKIINLADELRLESESESLPAKIHLRREKIKVDIEYI